MERIAEYLAMSSLEGAVFAASSVALGILFAIVASERKRGMPYAVVFQHAAGRIIEGGYERIRAALRKAAWSAENVPRQLFAKGVHALATLALALVHLMERVLKKVLDAVRGKRELQLGVPPSSSFFTEILPHHRRNSFHGGLGAHPEDLPSAEK